MTFTVRFSTDNAAFSEDDGEDTGAAMGAEIARILRAVARAVNDGAENGDTGTVHDVNGNTVGVWSLA